MIKTPSPKTAYIDDIIRNYGDMIYDLAETILWNTGAAAEAFREILKTIISESRHSDYKTHRRAWVLRIAINRLTTLFPSHGRRLSPSEQVMLDANNDISSRLKQFEAYFHKLELQDQFLLILRDKYGIPYSELATVMGIPEDSLKTQRQRSLRTLEEWLWNRT